MFCLGSDLLNLKTQNVDFVWAIPAAKMSPLLTNFGFWPSRFASWFLFHPLIWFLPTWLICYGVWTLNMYVWSIRAQNLACRSGLRKIHLVEGFGRNSGSSFGLKLCMICFLSWCFSGCSVALAHHFPIMLSFKIVLDLHWSAIVTCFVVSFFFCCSLSLEIIVEVLLTKKKRNWWRKKTMWKKCLHPTVAGDYVYVLGFTHEACLVLCPMMGHLKYVTQSMHIKELCGARNPKGTQEDITTLLLSNLGWVAFAGEVLSLNLTIIHLTFSSSPSDN